MCPVHAHVHMPSFTTASRYSHFPFIHAKTLFYFYWLLMQFLIKSFVGCSPFTFTKHVVESVWRNPFQFIYPARCRSPGSNFFSRGKTFSIGFSHKTITSPPPTFWKWSSWQPSAVSWWRHAEKSQLFRLKTPFVLHSSPLFTRRLAHNTRVWWMSFAAAALRLTLLQSTKPEPQSTYMFSSMMTNDFIPQCSRATIQTYVQVADNESFSYFFWKCDHVISYIPSPLPIIISLSPFLLHNSSNHHLHKHLEHSKDGKNRTQKRTIFCCCSRSSSSSDKRAEK